MPIYTFPAAPVHVESTGGFAIGSTGVLRAYVGGEAVPMWDMNDSPITSVTVGQAGAYPDFKADIPDGVMDFGSVPITAISKESFTAALDAKGIAESALSQAETLQTSKAAVLHTHGVADIAATGTPGVTTYLRGDGTWSSPEGGGTGFLDGGSATSTFSDLVIDGGAAA